MSRRDLRGRRASDATQLVFLAYSTPYGQRLDKGVDDATLLCRIRESAVSSFEA